MMSGSDSGNNSSSRMPSRRAFLWMGGGAVAAIAAYRLHAVPTAVEAKPDLPKEVKIVEFSPDGKKTGVETIPTIVKTDAEWKAQLSPDSYYVTRHEGTERAYTGQYWNLHDQGIYQCVCCGTPIFNANTKFESGTGWPSFWQPIAKENVREITDISLGMERTAVACRRCDAHLGHVFGDGPQPTGLRYCMNSVSMKFVKA